MKEIGGYFELEKSSGEEYYPELYKINLGRTAMKLLVKVRGYKKVYLPHFLCDSVIAACEEAGCATEYYSHRPDYSIDLPERILSDDEVLYLVNHYGQLTDEKILEYKKKYGNVIVDHTHDFFRHPLPGIDTLYSVRKYFGVSDGAYVSTDAELGLEDYEQDRSYNRMEHILGRFDADAGTFYKKMLDNAAGYHGAPIMRMSKVTENLLKSIDYESVKEARNRNYAALKKYLPDTNDFNKITPDGPFTYPFHNEQGVQLRKNLAARKIFVPTYWSNILSNRPWTAVEYAWASNILPIPCDQRYTEEDMKYVAEAVKEEAAKLG